MKTTILFFLLLLNSCQKADPYSSAGYTLLNSFATEIRLEKNLHLFMLGGSFYDKINKLNISFATNRITPIDLAREIFIQTVDQFLKKINQDENIKPFLNHYPFILDDISLSILFLDYKLALAKVAPPLVSHINIANGKITYSYNDPATNRLVIFHRETYNEALNELKQQESKEL